MDVMQLRRNLLMMPVASPGGLPAEYLAVEYLESTGTQWIETNYIPPAGVTAEWDYSITGTFTGDRMMWGARDNTNTGRCYAERYGNNWYSANGYARYASVLNSKGTTIGTKYHATISSSEIVVDGNSASPTDTTYTSPGKEIYIFAWNSNGTADWKHTVLRMYGLKFTYNGSVQADFIPCIRISDSKPGMYDAISKTFFTNSGTGEFIVGYDWDYVYTAEADGFVGKYRIPVEPGDHVAIEWDVSKYASSPRTGYQTAFAVNNSSGGYATPADGGLSGNYPICCNNDYNSAIFATGKHSFVCGDSVAYVVIGYWYETIKNRDYNLYGDYVKIKIN